MCDDITSQMVSEDEYSDHYLVPPSSSSPLSSSKYKKRETQSRVSFLGFKKRNSQLTHSNDSERTFLLNDLNYDQTDDEEINTCVKRDDFVLKKRNLNYTESRDDDIRFNDFLRYKIQPNDTLQSIALKYGCSVSLLKRHNHLINDHEFHALRMIKLPIKKYGILSEVLHHQMNGSNHVNGDGDCDVLPESTITVNLGIGQHLRGDHNEDASIFLAEMDKDLQRIRDSTKTVIETSQVNHMISDTEAMVKPLPISYKNTIFSCDEADYGINWTNLLIIAFLLCFLIPVIYVLYVSEEHS